jgi:magnesium-transporting ATPase (P-type)
MGVSLLVSKEPQMEYFSKGHFKMAFILLVSVQIFSWVTLFLMALTFWISNYSNSTLGSDLDSFFSPQNMLFFFYTGVMYVMSLAFWLLIAHVIQ